MWLRPKHGCEREADLLSSGKTSDLPVAAHLLINSEGFAMPCNLAPCKRSLIDAGGLGGDALVTRNDDL